MIRLCLVVMIAAVSLGGITPAFADPAAPLVVKPGDTIQKLLEGYKGKRVTLKLHGGDELTGKVITVGRELVHLEELLRRENFDAVVDVSKIEALIVRVKE